MTTQDSVMVRTALAAMLEKRRVDAGMIENAFAEIVAGHASAAQIAGLAVALRMKGEEAHEIAAAVRAVMAAVTPLPDGIESVRARAVDTCGTGGDGKGSFNISTTAAFIVAAAGVPVAKHGNRAISSKAGSADVLAALGVRLDMPPEVAARCLADIHITFLLAPHYHPALRHAAAPRQELGVRTIFNLIGPLANPASAPFRVVGVYDPALTELYAHALAEVGVERAWVVHGAGGYDEMTLLGATRVSELQAGNVNTFTVDPGSLGLRTMDDAKFLRGGDRDENAVILQAILDGEESARADTVALNAGAAIHVAGGAASLAEGLERARTVVKSGAARHTLDELVRRSNAT